MEDVKPPLARRLLAEALGTGLLVTVVVGSGIAAQQLSPGDDRAAAAGEQHGHRPRAGDPDPDVRAGVRRALQPGGLGGRLGSGTPCRYRPLRPDVVAYGAAQVVGAVAGAVLANVMFGA